MSLKCLFRALTSCTALYVLLQPRLRTKTGSESGERQQFLTLLGPTLSFSSCRNILLKGNFGTCCQLPPDSMLANSSGPQPNKITFRYYQGHAPSSLDRIFKIFQQVHLSNCRRFLWCSHEPSVGLLSKQITTLFKRPSS